MLDVILSFLPIVIAVVILLVLLLMGYVKAPPDQAYIISGLKKDGKILIGRAGIKVPFFERLDKLYLKRIRDSLEQLLQAIAFRFPALLGNRDKLALIDHHNMAFAFFPNFRSLRDAGGFCLLPHQYGWIQAALEKHASDCLQLKSLLLKISYLLEPCNVLLL